MKVWLVLLGTLPLLAVGSAATAERTPVSTPQDGLIAVTGRNGISLIDPVSSRRRLVLWSAGVSGTEWSPDGRLFAFSVSDDYDSSSVYTIRADGSGLSLVLRHAWETSWSPDGKRLAVVREEGSDDSADLLVVGADGRDVRKLTSAEYLDSPVWSPDGKWIAVNADDGTGDYRIELVQTDGPKTLPVPDSSEGEGFAWSPDGSSLAFVGDDGVYLFRLPFGKAERLSRGANLEDLAWSPDGSKIAFHRHVDRPPVMEVVSLDVATRRLTVLSGPIPGWAPLWSPDGRELAFLAGPEPGLRGRGPVHANDLWIVNADGSDPRRIAAALDEEEWPLSWARGAPASALTPG